MSRRRMDSAPWVMLALFGACLALGGWLINRNQDRMAQEREEARVGRIMEGLPATLQAMGDSGQGQKSGPRAGQGDGGR